MRIALVHEFLTQLGGAERVLSAIHEIFPEAPVYTLVYDQERTHGVFAGWDIRTSFLQSLPGSPKRYKWYLPLMPGATEAWDFSQYDLVLSDSSAFAKGVITRPPTVQICYCHTPTRYIWQEMEDYVSGIAYPGIIKAATKLYLKNILKPWDYKAAQRPDFFIANSQTVRARIKKYYNRAAEVIYPPVDTNFFRPGLKKGDYFFTASRLEPYKNIELVIEAFNRLKLPLKVAGTGTQLLNLESKILNPKIEFLGRVTDENLRELYQNAKAFVFPAYEDAGIMILESLACGTPVIGLAAGGTAEFVAEGRNGVLFAQQNTDAIIAAVQRFSELHFDAGVVRATALPFAKEIFQRRILEFIHTHAHRQNRH